MLVPVPLMNASRGILLVNLGSPDTPSVPDVRRYLREFLGDERVLDIPQPLRWMLLEGVILRTRPKHSAEAYRSIWTDEGSPLIRTSERVRDQLAAALGRDTPVFLAMRYGRPSIHDVLGEIADAGVTELLLIPQYPHYAMSSWETVVAKVHAEAAALSRPLKVQSVSPFFSDPDYIEALHLVSAPYLTQPYDHVLFSYHGVPLRHLRNAGCVCGRLADAPACCEPSDSSYATCYRAQALATTRAFASRARLPRSRYSVSFQSRLAGEPWLAPYTDATLAQLPGEGVKRLLVLCPAFVTDCLETLEEIAVAGRETFLAAGGESFVQIPCLNDQAPYIDFLAGRARRWLDRERIDAEEVAHLAL